MTLGKATPKSLEQVLPCFWQHYAISLSSTVRKHFRYTQLFGFSSIPISNILKEDLHDVCLGFLRASCISDINCCTVVMSQTQADLKTTHDVTNIAAGFTRKLQDSAPWINAVTWDGFSSQSRTRYAPRYGDWAYCHFLRQFSSYSFSRL